jgi:hypothetical protein
VDQRTKQYRGIGRDFSAPIAWRAVIEREAAFLSYRVVSNMGQIGPNRPGKEDPKFRVWTARKRRVLGCLIIPVFYEGQKRGLITKTRKIGL